MEPLRVLERKCYKLEQELEDYRRQLDTIIRNLPDIVYMLDAHGRIVFISDNIVQFGYDPRQLIGKPLLDLIHPKDRDNAKYRINERRTGDRKTVAFELELLAGNKDSVPMEIRTCDVNEKPKFTVTAEGYYLFPQEDKRQFKGTVGIAREIHSTVGLDATMEKMLQKWDRSPNYLPICSSCKRFRDESGEWQEIEAFFEKGLHMRLTHTICHDCSVKLYPELHE